MLTARRARPASRRRSAGGSALKSVSATWPEAMRYRDELMAWNTAWW
ncbi:hypothetical protein [Streptomyces syringium]